MNNYQLLQSITVPVVFILLTIDHLVQNVKTYVEIYLAPFYGWQYTNKYEMYGIF